MKDKVTAGRIWGVIYPEVLYQVVAIVVEIVIIFVYMFKQIEKGIELQPEKMLNNIYGVTLQITMLAGLVSIPIMAYLMKKDVNREKELGRYKKYKKTSVGNFALIIPFAIFVMLAGNYFVSILTLFMPKSMLSTYDSAQQAIYGSSFMIQIIAGGIVAPIIEEMINRGLVYNRIKRMSGVVPAAILSALIFGAIHMNFVQAPYAFIIGLVAVYLYEKYKTIVAPIMLHMTANLLSLVISYFSQGNADASEQLASQYSIMTATVYFIYFAITAVIAFALGKVIHNRVTINEIKENI